MTDIDGKAFWRLMGARAVGVPVVAAQGADGPAGLLALSASHVSATPPTMLVSISRSTSALGSIKSSGAFAISYLPDGAEEIAETFGGRRAATGAGRFVAGEWTTLKTGSPVLVGAVVAFDCTISATFTHGDVDIILGRIEAYSVAEGAVPLVAFGGRYRALR